MDFGFSPVVNTATAGGKQHLTDLQKMFARMANTTLISKGGMTSVRQFIVHLDKTTGITKPIGDLLIGSHANEEGQISVPMFPGQSGWTTFEFLEDTLSDTKKSIKIPDSLIGFTAGDPISHSVHLKGCNVGDAQPFLVKLQEAFGGNVNVTAPKFFHGATSEPQGSFEYMGYEFTVARPELFLKPGPKPGTKVPDRNLALSEFDGKKFPLIDGTTKVPTADWDKLIPPNPNAPRFDQATSKLGATFGKRTTIKTPRQYRVVPITFGPWTVVFPNPASVPKDEPTQLQELSNDLEIKDKHGRFLDAHPFPQWTREGFADLKTFIAGYKWKCTPKGASLICTGTRFHFVVALAITDPATTPAGAIFADGTLIFNFYPAAGSGLTAITTAIKVTDPKFFATT
jgi:hypothetical protein